MTPYQRGNRDGLLAFAAWARQAANTEGREVERCAAVELAPVNETQRRAAQNISTNAVRRMAVYNAVAREAERMAQALPCDPEETP
jgi:hypothetical protein